MLLTLLLSGYIPPSSEAINFFFGLFIFFVLTALALLWRGVHLLRRQQGTGWWLVMLAAGLPMLGWTLLGSIF